MKKITIEKKEESLHRVSLSITRFIFLSSESNSALLQDLKQNDNTKEKRRTRTTVTYTRMKENPSLQLSVISSQV